MKNLMTFAGCGLLCSDKIDVAKKTFYYFITMEFPEDVLSLIRGFAKPLRPKEREAKLIKAHVRETRDHVIQKLQLMARNDPFRNHKYQLAISMVDSWSHYGRAKIARRPPGWLRMPHYESTSKYDTSSYIRIYRITLQ
jgi:hypothetical protein